MKTLTKAYALVLCALPLMAGAGTKITTGTMQVSFTIVESCNVQTDAQRPAVSCQLNSPYQLNRGADTAATPAAAPRTDAGAQGWTVYF